MDKNLNLIIKVCTPFLFIYLGLNSNALAQQTCSTKGNYPLPEISASAKINLQQDLDAANVNLERNPNGINEGSFVLFVTESVTTTRIYLDAFGLATEPGMYTN
jgi:hypothetical protein